MREGDKNSKGDEEPDYYLENGLLVFTEAYHRRRGYCCESGCRHCPYGFKRDGLKSNPPSAEERESGKPD